MIIRLKGVGEEERGEKRGKKISLGFNSITIFIILKRYRTAATTTSIIVYTDILRLCPAVIFMCTLHRARRPRVRLPPPPPSSPVRPVSRETIRNIVYSRFSIILREFFRERLHRTHDVYNSVVSQPLGDGPVAQGRRTARRRVVCCSAVPAQGVRARARRRYYRRWERRGEFIGYII